MEWNNVLKTVLVIVVTALLNVLFTAINVPVDEALLNTIALGIVVWLLSAIGVDVARARSVRGIK